MELKSIIKKPKIIDNRHESLYRCHDILRCVVEMVRRGDSRETILDVAGFLDSPEEKDNTVA